MIHFLNLTSVAQFVDKKNPKQNPFIVYYFKYRSVLNF